MKIRRLRLWLLLSALVLCGALLFAQTETGQIAGTVLDPTGAAVPNATVTVVNAANGATRTTNSTGSGDFAITNLLPGTYNIRVEASGFSTFKQTVQLAVGARVGVDAKMTIGNSAVTVEVTEAVAPVNTETQTLATTVTTQQIHEIPTVTRNPYDLVALSGNVSNAGVATRGVGYAINGQREASTNILLDGSANNNEFTATVGQAVPLDSVQEFSVLTSNFTAEFGRAGGGIVNVVTKSGTNSFHGTAYEFNRVSRFAANSFDNNAHGLPKNVYDRNQFGYSFGGPVKKDKLFFFSSTEWIRVRSAFTSTAQLFTPQFIAQTAPGVQSFFNAYGKLAPNVSVLRTYTGTQANLCGTNANAAGCRSFVAANPNLPIVETVAFTLPGDAGGGFPENEYQTVARVDYNLSDKTQMYGRYALQSRGFFPGYASSSPYNGYNTVENDFNNNGLFSITHAFSPAFVSQSKVVFNRLNDLQPYGTAGGQIPTLFTGASGVAQFAGINILMPGYNPSTPGSSIPFGGPQNFVQLYEDLSWAHGKHNFRFGGSYDYQRDNRCFGAYEDGAYYLGSGTGSLGQSISQLLAGTAYRFQAAVYPQGQLPGSKVNLPLTPPNFCRSNRYNEGAVYGQDAWKIDPRFTVNIGLRWEYYGVQHNKNPNLDSNFYDPPNQIDTPLGINQGQVYLAPTHGGLWSPRLTNFAPRIGFAWDVKGDGKTSVRGGWGIGYERNFGNVTFNVIQNPPNYESVQVTSGTSNFTGQIPISAANFGPFSGSSGTITLPAASLRNVDSDIRQAYSHFWSASLEHEFGTGFLVGADYTGSRGVHLYDIQVLNRNGYGNVFLGIPCSGAGCTAFLNNQYGGINRRGDRGWSNYNGLNFHTRYNVPSTGLTLTAAYTWSHALDNLSSTFSDTNTFAANNGDFNTGYLDPYAPMLDKGSSDFDARHRVSIAAVYAIPAFKNGTGLIHQIVGGWEIAPIFTANSGPPFSVFDGSLGFTDYPRAFLSGPLGPNGSGNPPSAGTNLFNYLTVPGSIIVPYVNPLYHYTDLPPFPSSMTGRNAFRAPGVWNLNVGVYKSFSLSERVQVQLRGEAFDLMNHSNLYVIGSSADLENITGSSYSITSCRGGCNGVKVDGRNLQLAAKIIF